MCIASVTVGSKRSSLQGSSLMELSARDQDVGNPNPLLLSISSGKRQHDVNTFMWDNVETATHETPIYP